MRNYQRKQADRKADIVSARTRGIGSHKSRGGFRGDEGDSPAELVLDDPRQMYTFAIVIRNAIVVALCICIAFPAAELARLIVPGVYATILPFASILLAIDLLLVAPRLSKLSIFSKDWFLFNGSRWIFILFVLKLLSYVGTSDALNAIWADLPLMRRDLFLYLFTPPFLMSMLVVLIVWSACRVLGSDLTNLTQGEQELEQQSEAGVRTDRAMLRQTLSTHVFAFGIFTVLLSGGGLLLARLTQRDISSTLVTLDLLLYFVLGLALIGHSQLTLLRANWLWERTPIARNLVRRWTVYGLAFLAGLVGLALVVPTTNVAGIVPALNYLIAALFYVVQFVAFLIIGLLQLILAPLFALLGQPGGAPTPPPAPIAPAPPITPDVPAVMPPWVDLLQTLIFFTIIAIVLIYALRYVLLQHTGLREALQKLPLVIWLREAWHGLRNLIRAGRHELRTLLQPNADATAIPNPNAAATSTVTTPQDPATTLPARQQITQLYLATLEHAREKGITRQPAQTPDEFARQLAQRLQEATPEATPDVSQLTQNFVEVRYSKHDVAEGHVSAVARYAQRVRQALNTVRPARKNKK